MKKLAVVSILLAGGTFATAQSVPQAGPEPTGIVVGSGNFFSPIVRDLDKAVAFYRDGLGFAVQGQPSDAAANPDLRHMFGLPDAKIRWVIARPPNTMGGVEIIEISDAGGRPLARRMQDPGAFTLLVIVRDLDSVFARLKALGAPVLTVGGAPARVPTGNGPPGRLVMVQDPDGHFVEIVQPGELPAAPSATPPNVIEVRVRLTVADLARSIRLYRDTLGLALVNESQFSDTVSDALGVPGARYRFGMMRIPTSGIMFEVIEFAGVERKTTTGRIQDPGSTRIQLRVRDMAEAIAALGKSGGAVVSTRGVPVELPAGQGKIKAAIDREPDNLFLVLIESPPANR
jgi:catechol 2,3-dioxygenase-like lactoylglutathione lyase family enzyme